MLESKRTFEDVLKESVKNGDELEKLPFFNEKEVLLSDGYLITGNHLNESTKPTEDRSWMYDILEQHPKLHYFELLDDDENLYLSGLSTNDSSFDPLDNEGSSYGCTILRYRNSNGKMEDL